MTTLTLAHQLATACLKPALAVILSLLLLSSELKAQEPKLMLPISHAQGIRDASFSADNKWVVSRSFNDVNAKVWDTNTGELIYNFPMEATVWFVKFSPDSKYLLTISKNKAKLWDLSSGTIVSAFENEPSNHIQSVVISNNSNTLFTAHNNNFIKVWDAKSGSLIRQIRFDKQVIQLIGTKDDNIILVQTQHKIKSSTLFTYDLLSQKKQTIASGSDIKTFIFKNNIGVVLTNKTLVYDTQLLKIIGEIELDGDGISSLSTSENGDKLIVCAADTIVSAYNTQNGALISSFTFYNPISNIEFTGNGDQFICQNIYNWAFLTETLTGDDLHTFEKDTLSVLRRNVGTFINFSQDNKHVLMVFDDNVLRMWNIEGKTPKLVREFTGKTNAVSANAVSRDSKHVAIGDHFGYTKVFDLSSGKPVATWQSHSSMVYDIKISHKGDFVVTYSDDSLVKVWDINTGKLLKELKHDEYYISSVDISEDDNYILTTSEFPKTLIKMWDWKKEEVVRQLMADSIIDARFDRDNQNLLITKHDSLAVFNLASNQIKQRIYSPGWHFSSSYSHDYQFILTLGSDSINIISALSGERVKGFSNLNNTGTSGLDVTLNNNLLIAGNSNGLVNVWEISTGKLLHSIHPHTSGVAPLLANNDNTLLTFSEDGTFKVWDFKNLNQLYQIIPLYADEYLVTDPSYRYDGTEAARKLLYFTCGPEVISLEQVKDQLWVPQLAARIMKGETINAAKLSDLEICGLTPVVESLQEPEQYKFSITPRKGGLGETLLMVNGIEVKKFKPGQLQKTTKGYELTVTAAELKPYFIPGQQNVVTVKGYTAKNDISSRGVNVAYESAAEQTAPNLYAVMVGVSDYKGVELDLKYAAKDAEDLSKALAASARKLLNADGKEHVFLYNLHTGVNRQQLPEKNAIKKVLEEIGQKATANDILLIFFAGHGVMEGENKQFYFLTADASKASAASASVGISTAELSQWMQPGSIKAQKRILILDACNSGQAIKELVKIGQEQQNYIAARNDDEAQQIKAIEKLNERSGLFILSASASNQSAYEMGRYAQGLLTYSLLKAMKEQPDILVDNKYLNLSRWFGAAEKTVTDIARETGARQQPQLVSTANFDIGIVDEEVMAQIILPQQKALFTYSNFQNRDEAVGGDDLSLTDLLNQSLRNISSRGTEKNISYIATSNTPEAYALKGSYEIKGEAVEVSVNLWKNKKNLYRYQVKGKANELNKLVEEMILMAGEWIEEKQ